MKRKMHSVLRSQTGASIVFALLMFLVCAVVGALVLTAGTAAAGRVSNLAQMDQRYYSVSSAADLLAKELSGKKVTITRTRELTEVTKVGYLVDLNGSGSLVTLDPANPASSGSSAQFSTKVNDLEISNAWYSDSVDAYEGNDISTENISFLNQRASELLFGDVGLTGVICNTDEAMEVSMKNGHEHTGFLQLTHSTGAVENVGELTVKCRYDVLSDGKLLLTLTNVTGDTKNHYVLRLTFSPTINETQTETKNEDTSRTYSDNGYIEQTTTVTTLQKVSEITWNFSGVEKKTYDAVYWGEATEEGEGG